MATLNLGRRQVACDARLRRAVDDLAVKYPRTFELGLLGDGNFHSVQYDLDDGIIHSEEEIRRAVCQSAQAAVAQQGQTNLRFTLYGDTK